MTAPFVYRSQTLRDRAERMFAHGYGWEDAVVSLTKKHPALRAAFARSSRAGGASIIRAGARRREAAA